MIKISLITIVLCFFTLIRLEAQEPIIEKGFLIIHSSKDYSSALNTAKEASVKLDIDIDLRGYYADEETGLKSDSICDCGELHGYIARGRYDDRKYVSIEYSDSYEGFTKGYYVVVVASDTTYSEQLTETLAKTKNFYADAYVKNTSVYIGCMH